MRIRKISQIAGFVGTISNSYSTSSNDTYSCSYINNKDVWTSLGTQTGTTAIALPNNFKELMVEVDTAHAGCFQFYLIREMLSSTNKEFGNGGFISANNNCSQLHITASTTSVSITYVYQNGENDVTSTSTIKAWYK